MKRGRSTGKPTKKESEYIVSCKEGFCVCCHLWMERTEGMIIASGGNDFHHFKSGNVRRGHSFGIGLCVWHHRGHPFDGSTSAETRLHYGPSLMDGSRLFHETYGSDDELLAVQQEILNQ